MGEPGGPAAPPEMERRALPAVRYERQGTATPPSVLFVDPDVASTRHIAEVLRARYQVAVVATAQQAWTTVQAQLPSMVVLELDLPDASGLQLLAALQQ